MGKIILEEMEFFAFHGCFKEEQIIGSRFIADLEVEYNSEPSERSDHLADTVDYAAIYRCVKQEMEVKSHLLEHLGKRIIDSIVLHFPAIDSIILTISKVNPPMGGKMNRVSFVKSWKK